ASSGIGTRTALLLHQKGYVVYAAARRLDRMKELQAQGIHILRMDVTIEESMVKGVETIISEQGSIDILINNAGYGSYGALEDVPIAEGKYQFEVNVFGMARLTQLILPHMRKNHYGKIINISSIAGKIYEPMGSWYHATKFAVEGMSDCLRLEVKDFGIDVIVIEPGLIKTEWGGIAVEKLLKVSGNTAYKYLAQKDANLLNLTIKRASEPTLISRIILKSILAKKPKTRYSAGTASWASLFFRKILTDKMFDKLMMTIIKRV
ncbi:MAG: oxidoreductase, partial [Bacteroidota bacterium]|nr:oxidoreductase [Bacteroidota bacterium]